MGGDLLGWHEYITVRSDSVVINTPSGDFYDSKCFFIKTTEGANSPTEDWVACVCFDV